MCVCVFFNNTYIALMSSRNKKNNYACFLGAKKCVCCHDDGNHKSQCFVLIRLGDSDEICDSPTEPKKNARKRLLLCKKGATKTPPKYSLGKDKRFRAKSLTKI